MTKIDSKKFERLVSESIDTIPLLYRRHLKDVAFIIEDEPTKGQRQKLGLACDQTLFGLYEGVPLPQRGGTTKLLPDKITLFKNPLLDNSRDLDDLREIIRHTVWHEVAHYYGLDHTRIHELENKKITT